MSKAKADSGLGAGKISAVFLAQELVLMDESRGRRFAKQARLAVVGCVGILEHLYRQRILADLRCAYAELLSQNIRIDCLHLGGVKPSPLGDGFS